MSKRETIAFSLKGRLFRVYYGLPFHNPVREGLPIITGQFFESHSLKLHPRGVFLFSWILFLSRRSSLSYSDLRRSMLEGQSPDRKSVV